MELQSFSSLPPHEEAQFVVFERATQEGLHKGFMAALITSIAIAVLSLAIYFGFAPEKKHKKAEDDKTQTTKGSAKGEAATPDK